MCTPRTQVAMSSSKRKAFCRNKTNASSIPCSRMERPQGAANCTNGNNADTVVRFGAELQHGLHTHASAQHTTITLHFARLYEQGVPRELDAMRPEPAPDTAQHAPCGKLPGSDELAANVRHDEHLPVHAACLTSRQLHPEDVEHAHYPGRTEGGCLQ